MAGGTGGHVFPALAVARELRAGGHQVHWLGTRRGIEADVIPAAEIPIHYIQVGGLRGKGLRTLLMAPLQLARALVQALRVIRSLKPDCVLGMGGFAAGPGGLVAWLSRVPLVIHEQNSVAGMTNRWLARFARRVLQAFEGAFPEGPRVERVGNPVRRELRALPHPESRILRHDGRPHFLVLGGSLGAAAINELVPQAVALLSPDERPEILHQAGRRHFDATTGHYRAAGVTARVVPFIDEMEEAYQWADFVLCRAGAMTVSELGVAGLGAIFVPFPHAVDDHQTRNARYLAEAGAGRVLQQSELSAERLAQHLREVFGDPAGIRAMAVAAYGQSHPHAAERVAAVCLEVAHG